MIKIYNTLSKQKEPLTERSIGIYVCGPTVYDEPHIGHARSAYVFDIIVKYMRYTKYKVKFVRNITDIDDKIINRALTEPGVLSLKNKVKAISKKYLKRYHEDMALLGMAKPDIEPKATETINDIIKFIKILIKNGYAYAAGANVYFNVRKFRNYGKLSGQSIDEMEEGARVTLDKNKLDPLDFALWKASKEDEPSWPSPWGDGRPGWHIECSVMSTKYLGNKFLIHGGGLDLIFPHHENEIAQTVCAGKKSAKYWIHNGLLTINGQKMSKSLGNFISIKDFAGNYKDLDLLKLLFLSSHYRQPVDYTEGKIEEMKRAKERICVFYNKIKEGRGRRPKEVPRSEASPKGDEVEEKTKGRTEEIERIKNNFTQAMDDDFNTPLALASIFELVNLGNICLSTHDINLARKIREIIDLFAAIFGLSFEAQVIELEPDIENLINERNKARKDRDFKKADDIRKTLTRKGIILEDGKEGTTWRKKS